MVLNETSDHASTINIKNYCKTPSEPGDMTFQSWRFFDFWSKKSKKVLLLDFPLMDFVLFL